ncbi:MAG: T9SS type A sorting domain-containing protein [Bacteroidetes bacterium]|nr:T9SS type A sorting domain-containing protein [Bacteroidota bacterium]
MKVQKLAFSFLILTLILPAKDVQATHIVFGNLSYETLSTNDSMIQCKVKVELFRDCYNSITPFDQVIQLGVYEGDSNKRIQILSMYLLQEDKVETDSLTSWPYKPNVCLIKGIYIDTFWLKKSKFGYHLYYQRCCRTNFTNLVENSGMTLYQFIQSDSIINNSPSIAKPGLIFCCVNDSSKFSRTVVDKDNDSLVVSFVKSWEGGSYADPMPFPPPSLGFPIATIPYASSYSLSEPFGKSSFSSYNSSEDSIELFCPDQGLYSLALQVEEYRNNIKIGSSRFGLAVYSSICPWNWDNVADENSRSVKIYPNPNNGQKLTIDIGNRQEDGYIEIYNLMGQKMLCQPINPLEQRIEINNISQFKDGLYILQITQGDKRESFKLDVIR